MKGGPVVTEMSRVSTCWWWLLLLLTACWVVVAVGGLPTSGSERNVTQRHTQLKTKWTAAELTSRKFPKLISDDIDMDPCKGDGFLGDIALPNVQYDAEWKSQVRNESYQMVLEKYKKQIFMEGLQVEEEGLVGLQEKDLQKEVENQSTLDHGDTATGMKRNKSKRANKHSKSSKKNKKNKKPRNRQRQQRKNRDRDEKRKEKKGKRMRGAGRRRHSEEASREREEEASRRNVDPLRDLGGGDERQRRLDDRAGGEEHLLAEHGTGRQDGGHAHKRSRVTRAATARKERVWDYGVIPYTIDANFSGPHKSLFKQAMRHWENFTCLQFVERDPAEHPNYIVFTERPCGCCSFVGKRGNGAQAISIGKNCDKFGIVVHELGHVVGFWHEHTRPDRDHHVVIIRDNIMLGQEYNFNKLTEEEVNSLGLSYDYDSIMHYARNTFSKGSYLNTILPRGIRHNRDPPEIGQRVRLSEGDIAQTNLLYRCFRCGRTFQDSSGSFSSPAYPNSLPGSDGDRCEWRITATHGESIVLNITDLDIFLSDDCKTDYLEIRDGYWHKSNVLGRFCGTSENFIDSIISTGNRVVVRYITSSRQVGHRGFTINYEAVCGGDWFMEGTALLESPNYPDDYPPNKECIWRISTTKTFKIALKFQSFEVENHDNCVYDYLEIRDGLTLDSPLIGIYCGYRLPADVESSGNEILIRFVSDGSVQKPGIALTYMAEYDECAGNTEHECEHECINTLGGYKCACRIGYDLHSDGKHCEGTCGEVVDAVDGAITSPNFPSFYPLNKFCVWEIVAPPLYRVILNFTHFDLEGNNNCGGFETHEEYWDCLERIDQMFQYHCEYDSVTVYSKTKYGLLREGVFCGSNLPASVTSKENSLRVEFKSDNSVSKTGFGAIFLADLDECARNQGGCQHDCRNTIGSYECRCHNGFVLHENGHDCKEGGCKNKISVPTGVIKSPNFPDYYPSRKDCVWHFTTTPGHRIKLVFADFELEPHQECAYDHVVIYDGDTSDSPTLGRFCGSKVPHPILATGNQMLMVFKSDASVQRRGFNATHSTACGGHLQAGGPVQHLYSHARYGDFTYGNKADCDWVIEAPPGENVFLMFLTFEVEDDGDCNFDYVQVFAGMDSSAPSLGRFCGNAIPPEILSPAESLLIRFRSDDSIGGKGFSIAYIINDPLHNVDLSAEVGPGSKFSSGEYDSKISSEEVDTDLM